MLEYKVEFFKFLSVQILAKAKKHPDSPLQSLQRCHSSGIFVVTETGFTKWVVEYMAQIQNFRVVGIDNNGDPVK